MADLIDIVNHSETMIVRFTRPESRNPLSRIVVERLIGIVDTIDVRTVRKLIITGSGEAFASGANLHEIAALSTEAAPDFARLGQSLMKKIDDLPLLVIAAVNGHCFGGALDLALSCDIRIASPDAKFAHPGAGLGIITGWGGTQRLPRLIGTALANEMFFSASPIDSNRALQIGLIDDIADDVLEVALKTFR